MGRVNPHASKVTELRAAFVKAVTIKDMREVIASLVTAAKAGDVAAARELLTHCIGKPADALDMEKLGGVIVVFSPGQRDYADEVIALGGGPEARNRLLDMMPDD